MKSIIQKIILNYFGKFIKGIQRDKLHLDIFGGNFKLENISLNQQYFDSLDTPFKLAYSSIGMLNIQAPLSKLSSVPVQCIIDNIYMIFQFKDTAQNLNIEQQILKKQQALKKYITQLFNNYLQKIKQQKKQDGMFAKLGKKIVDNLKLKIVNVHIRFQQKIKKGHYGWGITLQQISFIPTDHQWKPTFIDRSIEANKNQRLFKTMHVKKFNIYWQSGYSKNSILINSLGSNLLKIEKMSQMIKQQSNVILSITSQFKLVINPLENQQKPIYQLEVCLQPIKFSLERKQISQMIDFIQKNVIQNQMILRNLTRKKNQKKVQISLQTKQKYLEYVEYILNRQQQQTQLKDNLNQEKIHKILEEVQMDDLMLWALEPVKKKIKQLRQSQLKRKKRGWFGGQNQLTETQLKQLQVFIQEAFDTQLSTSRSPDCLFFEIKLTIEGGKFILIDRHQDSDNDQLIQFGIGQINSSIAKSQNQSLLIITLQIQGINLDLLLPKYQSKQKNRMSIIVNQQRIHNSRRYNDKGEKFIKMKYQKQVKTGIKTTIKTNVRGYIQRVIVTYKKLYMKKFKQFFTFNNVNQYVKNTTLEKIQQMRQGNQEKQDISSISIQKITDLHMDIISPMFICPLNQQECWCLSLGNLQLRSSREEGYSCYPMTITSAYLKHYPKISWCYNEELINYEEVFSVVNDMDFHLHYKQGQNNSVMDMKLPSFQINFTQKQYNNLLSLKNIFKIQQENQNLLETLKKQRLEIQSQLVYQGNISKKNQTLNTWRQYHGILSGPYIYLYNNKKQLKYIDRIFIKNAKLTIQLDQLYIISQYVDCCLQCDTMEELGKWKFQIEAKMKQYKTIYQLFQYYEQSQQSDIESNSFIKQSMKKQKQINASLMLLRVNKIGFKYQNQKRQVLMDIQITQLKMERQKSFKQMKTKFTMVSMKIVDNLYIYPNQQYQPLFTAHLLEMEYISKQLKQKKQKKTLVKVDLPSLNINWKPDVLLVLLGLLNKHFSRQIQMRFDDGQQFSRKNLFKQVSSDPKFMFVVKQYQQTGKDRTVKDKRQNYLSKQKWMKQSLKVECNVGQMNISMIHRQSHLVMFQILSEGISNQFSMGQNQKYVSGSIKNLSLLDMTGYPKKQYSIDKTQPGYKIIYKKYQEEVEDKPIIIYKWTSYQPLSLPNQDRVDSFLYIEVSPIQCTYFQQITFRLIDYVLIQIILLLQQPEMITANQNLIQQLKKNTNIKQKPVKILFSQYQQIIKRIMRPYFMDMCFVFSNISLTMLGQKKQVLYFCVDIQSLKFVNKIKKDSKRFIKCECQDVRDYIYQQQYVITGTNVSFNLIQQKNQQKIIQTLFGPIQLQIIINKLLQEDQINIIYPQINTYDRSFTTFNRCSQITINKLSRNSYLLLNKLINFNFTFDDQKDQLFIHNFIITKLLSPKPILYQLFIPQFKINGTLFDDIPLFNANLTNFKLLYKRNKDLNSSFQMWIGNTNIIGYQLLDIEECIQTNKNNKNQQKIQQINKYKYKQYQLIKIHSKQQQSIDILIDMKTTGEKVINLNVKQLQVYIHIGLLQVIFEWSLTQDWIFPTRSTYLNQITFFATVHSLSGMLMENQKLYQIKSKKKLSHIHMKQKMVDYNQRMFKLVGVLCYKFHRKRMLAPQVITERLLKRQMQFDDIQQMPQTSYMTIILNTEVYHCLTSSNKKRKILQKFTFNMMQKRFMKVSDFETCSLKNVSKRNLNIDRGLFKISFTDIILMNNLLSGMKQQSAYSGKVNKFFSKNIQVFQIQKLTQLSSLDNLQLQIQTISLYIINNCNQRFIPVIRINLNTINLSKCNTFKKDMLEGDLSLGLYYFNVTIFRWQPVIQKTSISFNRLVYYEDKKTIACLQFLKPLLGNISRQMFVTFKQTHAQWSRSKQRKSIDDEPIEFISHYIIRNQTGYPIQIYNSSNIKKHLIQHDHEIDYKHQIDDYDEQKQQDIVIAVKILHNNIKLKTIANITINPQKQFTVYPQNFQSQILQKNAMIIFKPVIKNSKQYLIISSSKKIMDYNKNPIKIITLPFDYSDVVQLPQYQVKVSLYKQVQDKIGRFRYVGNKGTLKIMKKNLVYNYTPIPLIICGQQVQPNDYTGISQKLIVQGQKQKQSMLKIDYNQKSRSYYIYCQAYVVDYYGLTFRFSPEYEYKLYSYHTKLHQYNYTIYLLPHADAKFYIKMGKNSQWISYRASLGKNILKMNNQKSLCYFSAYTYLSSYNNPQIKQFKQVIEITPQYVISNTTKYQLKISQIQSCTSLALKPFERVPFFWENADKPQLIKVAAYDGQQFWGFSGGLQIQRSTQSFILRCGSQPYKYKILTCQLQRTNTITFLHIMETSPQYILSNHIPGTTMVLYQTAIFEKDLQFNPKQFVYRVQYNQQKSFGYELPAQNHQITVEFILDKDYADFGQLTCQSILLDDLQLNIFQKQVFFCRKDNQKEKIHCMYLTLTFQDNIKKLKFMAQKQLINQQNKFEFVTKIPHIGISFIGQHNFIRKQLIHLIIQQVSIQINQTLSTTIYCLQLGSIRLQNQLHLNIQYPILLQSIKNRIGYALSFELVRDRKNTNLIHHTGFILDQLILTITSQEIQVLQNNIVDILSIKGIQQDNTIIRNYQLFNESIPLPQQNLYFIQAVISPFISVVTFKHVNNWGGKLMKTFASINQCPITIIGKKIKHFGCKDISQFLNFVMRYYQEQLKRNLLPLIGNLSILGSPMVLIQKIGTGVKDLMQLPYQGFEAGGVRSGGIGVAKGAKSLLKNTFQGTFNSLQSFTGSIGNGLSSLVDDDQYNRKRQRIRNQRSQNVVHGLKNGAKSVWNGFHKGITGVINKPVEGAQKNGIAGFFVGGFKGITGLVIKPISGLIDATSKTAEGLKNTASSLTPNQRLNLMRSHNPRPFYHFCREFRQYDPQLAFCLKVLESQDQKYSNLSWAGCYLLKAEKPDSTHILLLTYEYYVFYDLKKIKIIKSYHSEDIIHAELDGGFKVILSTKDRKNNNKIGTVTIVIDGSARKLHSELKAIIKSYRPTYLFDSTLKN